MGKDRIRYDVGDPPESTARVSNAAAATLIESIKPYDDHAYDHDHHGGAYVHAFCRSATGVRTQATNVNDQSYGGVIGIVRTLLVMVGLGRHMGLGLNMVRLGRLMVRRLAVLQRVLELKPQHQ